MEQKHRNILQTNFAYLIKNLHNVDEVCDHLVGYEILTSGMMDSIKHKKPRPTGQTRELLSILPRRGMKAYDSFIKALQETENKEIAAHLILKDTDGSKKQSVNAPTKGKEENGVIKEPTQQYSGKQEEKKNLESPNTKLEDWPDLSKRLQTVKKSDIKQCSKELYTKICESRQVYHMTGKKKGKLLLISNVQCADQSTEAKSADETLAKDQSCVEICRSCVDFDLTDINQLFKHMEYDAKNADTKRKSSGEEIKKFLGEQLGAEDNKSYDSLVIVFFSGGLGYEPAHIYDIDGNEVPTKEIFDMIRKSTAFKDKPKIVILRTYDFTKETKNYDVRDAEKASLNFINPKPNEDDLFVVSSQPKTKNGPWIIGDQMNGSYFIQALIYVFKNMAHEKSFMEMMEEVNKCLSSAMLPGQKKNPVAEVMILEHCNKKGLFFFPGLKDIPEVQMKVPIVKIDGWPDLTAGGNSVKKNDFKTCTWDFYNMMQKEKQGKIFPMTSVKRGKFILISNAKCIPQCTPDSSEEDIKKAERCSKCILNSDFDNTNMGQLFKYMGYDSTGGTIHMKTGQEIKDFLVNKLSDIDMDKSSHYDSLVVLFMSGKFEAAAGKIYDCDGEMIPKQEILDIIKSCQHFKGKPKVIFVQTYNFQEEQKLFDSTDSAKFDNIKQEGVSSNTDDIFVVSSYPRIEQGPWIIGENMSGSYFIQALIHVFKNFACEKSLIELLKEANKCLGEAIVPKMTADGKNSGEVEKKTVAQIVLLEYCKEHELYFFPGLKLNTALPKGIVNVNLSVSVKGGPVCAPSE